MRKHFLAALGLALATSSAWGVPVTFIGTYDVTVNAADPGLVVSASPQSGALNFDLDVHDEEWVWLFDIATDETWVNDDDRTPVAARIDFSFSSPTTFGGSAHGDTEGISVFWGLAQAGVLTWQNAGYNSLHFGDGGILDIHLQDAVFGEGLGGLSSRSAAVNATFSYRRGPLSVPEPVVLSLVGVGLLLVGIARWRRQASRRNRS